MGRELGEVGFGCCGSFYGGIVLLIMIRFYSMVFLILWFCYVILKMCFDKLFL